MMTTPERFRRRQRVEGGILMVLLVFTAGQSAYFNHADDEQRECLSHNFGALTEALETRTELSTVTGDLRDKRFNLLLDRFNALEDLLVLSATDGGQDLAARYLREVAEFRERTKDTKNDIRKAKSDLNKVEIPPYPAGTCD